MKKFLAILFALLVINTGAYAQFLTMVGAGTPPAAAAPSGITYVSSVDGGNNGGSGNYSESVTSPTTTNGLMVACVVGDTLFNYSTAATYAGQGMTLAQVIAPTQTFGRYVYLFDLLNPPSGANTLSITQTSGGTFLIPVIGWYNNVKQSGQPDATGTNQGATPLTTTWTVANSGSWGILCGQNGSAGGGGFSSGTGATFRLTDVAYKNAALYDSNGPLTAGSNSMQIHTAATDGSLANVVSFIPYSAPGFAVIGSGTTFQFAGSGGTSSGYTTTGANIIFVSQSYYEPVGTAAPTDSLTNTWLLASSQVDASTTIETDLYYCSPCTVGAGQTFSTTNEYGSMSVLAFSGAASSSPLQSSPTKNTVAGSFTIQPGSITPGQANSLIVTDGGVYTNTPYYASTISSGFTIAPTCLAETTNSFGDCLAYQIQTTATAENPTWTNATYANQFNTNMAVFKPN